ncbi:unnamed protein product [Amoebophrya sp. A120]|nr:unnamed protein product [Amoebophrya sp. A120]|eukprot:GSA120T00023661001.1
MMSTTDGLSENHLVRNTTKIDLESLTKEEVAKHLELLPHPEGGFFKETWRSSVSSRSGTSDKQVVCGTAIYFLLGKNDRSHLHVLTNGNDEVWHHYAGGTLEIVEIDPDCGRENSKLNAVSITRLGKNILHGEKIQHTVKAGKIFGSRMLAADGPPVEQQSGTASVNWALVGCTVCPGFEFEDFAILSRNELLKQFPMHTDIILDLTRPDPEHAL